MFTERTLWPYKRKDIIIIIIFCETHSLEVHHIETLTYVLSSTTTKFYYFLQYKPHVYVVILRPGDGQHDRSL